MTLLTDFDVNLMGEGTHTRLYERLGAHLGESEGAPGAFFAVWAPSAHSVSIIGTFNDWNPGVDLLVRRPDDSGIWERFVPGVLNGDLYKYSLSTSADGPRFDKLDPYGFAAEIAPQTVSKVWDLTTFPWDDADWLARRRETNDPSSPISIYEVNLGSWMRVPEEENRWLTYREIAPKLAKYALAMGFTHIELMPIFEHSSDGSGGDQTVGYFAPTRRFGTPDDFMFLVDCFHQNGLGLILDWTLAHFPRDAQGLGFFDGTPLYENPEPRPGEGVDRSLDTYRFDYGRPEVACFLACNALFWLDRYHIDGLRVDGVASMVYLDDLRKRGEWVPNEYGGRENLEAISFIRRVNEQIHQHYPGVLTFAEEATSWPLVTRSKNVGGLGFDQKWDVGWTHDTLSYLSHDPIERKNHHNSLTFRVLYAFSENYVLPLSHDEIVNLKGSLLNKMPGDSWQKFANLRLLFGWMFTQPGKKLVFMGGEFGQWREWTHESSLDWHLLDEPFHAGVKRWVRDLNTTYRGERSLHELDFQSEGFSWVDCNDVAQSVVCYLRKGRSAKDLSLVVCNFTPVPRSDYRVGVPAAGRWDEILNSDATLYGGSGQGNTGAVDTTPIPWHGLPQSLSLTLPPLAMILLRNRS